MSGIIIIIIRIINYYNYTQSKYNCTIRIRVYGQYYIFTLLAFSIIIVPAKMRLQALYTAGTWLFFNVIISFCRQRFWWLFIYEVPVCLCSMICKRFKLAPAPYDCQTMRIKRYLEAKKSVLVIRNSFFLSRWQFVVYCTFVVPPTLQQRRSFIRQKFYFCQTYLSGRVWNIIRQRWLSLLRNILGNSLFTL